MGKSVFTIIFLIVALTVAIKVQTFVENNRPKDVPVTPIIDESQTIDLVNPVIYEAIPDYSQTTEVTEASTSITVSTTTPQ